MDPGRDCGARQCCTGISHVPERGKDVMRDAVTTIGKLTDRQSVVFISSVDEDGFPNTKAMVRQYKSNPQACIYFCDKRFYRGAMLTGTMEVLEDAEVKKMLWQEGDTMYYPLGVTDPDYCVLRFTAVKGRFYSNFHSEDFEIE